MYTLVLSTCRQAAVAKSLAIIFDHVYWVSWKSVGDRFRKFIMICWRRKRISLDILAQLGAGEFLFLRMSGGADNICIPLAHPLRVGLTTRVYIPQLHHLALHVSVTSFIPFPDSFDSCPTLPLILATPWYFRTFYLMGVRGWGEFIKSFFN